MSVIHGCKDPLTTTRFRDSPAEIAAEPRSAGKLPSISTHANRDLHLNAVRFCSLRVQLHESHPEECLERGDVLNRLVAEQVAPLKHGTLNNFQSVVLLGSESMHYRILGT